MVRLYPRNNITITPDFIPSQDNAVECNLPLETPIANILPEGEAPSEKSFRRGILTAFKNREIYTLEDILPYSRKELYNSLHVKGYSSPEERENVKKKVDYVQASLRSVGLDLGLLTEEQAQGFKEKLRKRREETDIIKHFGRRGAEEIRKHGYDHFGYEPVASEATAIPKADRIEEFTRPSVYHGEMFPPGEIRYFSDKAMAEQFIGTVCRHFDIKSGVESGLSRMEKQEGSYPVYLSSALAEKCRALPTMNYEALGVVPLRGHIR